MDKMTLLPEEYKRILRIKRDLHMHPELSKAEYRTSGVIRTFLEKLPCVEILKTGTPTGVLAKIHRCAGKDIRRRERGGDCPEGGYRRPCPD